MGEVADTAAVDTGLRWFAVARSLLEAISVVDDREAILEVAGQCERMVERSASLDAPFNAARRAAITIIRPEMSLLVGLFFH